MLTPRFKLSQDENHVYITVHAPYTNIGETEIDIDRENFLFVSSPYFLRLRLPGRIVENDQSKGSYTCDSGDFNLTFDKETPGERFENLDMITSLLAPRDIPDVNPTLVEMLEEDGIDIADNESKEDDEPKVDDHESSEEEECNKYAFGFANKISTDFKDVAEEFPHIFDLRVPESVPVVERNKLRENYENNKFSSDHYLADLYEEELLAPHLDATIEWCAPDFNKEIDFVDEEVNILKELPNKHYLLNKKEQKQVFMGLVDILYGFCYDKRTTLNESNVESSWTINKLSPTLSFFCTFNSTKEILIACYRRALVFPIFRNFELCTKVHKDLVALLNVGKKFVIKCLISIFTMFNLSTDARYILNQLYIKDYIIFLQKCQAEEFDQLANEIAEIEISKNDLRLDLVELEAAAEMVKQEEAQIMENEMAVKLANLSLLPDLRNTSYMSSDETDDSTYSDSSTTDSDSDSSSDSSELDSDDERS